MNGRGISGIAVLSMSLLFLNLLIAISVLGDGGLENKKAIVICGIVMEAFVMGFLLFCNIYMYINFWNIESLEGSIVSKILRIGFICLTLVSIGGTGWVVSVFYKMIIYFW